MKILFVLVGCSTAIGRCDQETIAEGKGEIRKNHQMNLTCYLFLYFNIS